MSLPQTLRASGASLFALFGFLIAATMPAPSMAEERSPMHWSGDRTIYDRRSNKIELIGNAAVHQNKESLYADRVVLELDTKIVHALGSVSLVGSGALIQAQEMHFNLETRTGVIHNGRVSTENFTLSGERINKLGENRFQIYRGEYSTCKDCPHSWSFSAKNVDLELEGYAHLSNVTTKINDAPALWFPYLVVPIKTERQSGLLVPKLGFGSRGFIFVQPFFWAINRSFDMTLGAGNYSGRGRRLEWEGRYALSSGAGRGNFWHLSDRTFQDYLGERNLLSRKGYSRNRWAADVDVRQDLPFDLLGKLRFRDVSDNLYPSVIGDVDARNNPYLTSDASLTHSTDKVSVYILATRYRNLLNLSDPNPAVLANPQFNEDPRQFDNDTVQVLPQVVLTTNDKLFFNNRVAAGLSLGVTQFTRPAGAFDFDGIRPGIFPGDCTPGSYCPGKDPLREATRFTLNPKVSTSFRAADVVTIVPSVQYKQYFYDFYGFVPDLGRGYLQIQTDISTQFERIYQNDNPNIPKLKHLIRPKLTYSLIPYRHQPDHPFVRQIDYARVNNVTGYNFDSEDVIPLDASTNYANYFAPQGHSLAYGFTSQLIRKKIPEAGKGGDGVTPGYQRSVEWSAGQSFNFRELRKPSQDQKPLSRFYSLASVDFDQFTSYLDYYYTPYQPKDEFTSRHVYSTGAAYVFKRARKGVLDFERSVGASYSFNRSSSTSQTEAISGRAIFSINDYIMPSVILEYNLVSKRWQRAVTAVAFQSPSQCWRLDLELYQTIKEREFPGDSAWASNFRFNLAFNLTGSGYGVPGTTLGAAPNGQ